MSGTLRVISLASLLLLTVGERGVGAMTSAQECSEALFLVSAVVVTGSMVYDIASAPAAARHYNRKQLSIAPLVDPRRGSYGLSASWSFGRASHVASRSVATKSPSTAFILSFASTTGPMLGGYVAGNANSDAGWAVFLGGLVIGPSIGHFYAGNVGRGLATIGLRGAGTAFGLYQIVPCFD